MSARDAYVGPLFAGRTFSPSLDGPRLDTQLGRVWAIVRDGEWHDVIELRAVVPGLDSAITARLRDFRKAEHGGYVVESRRLAGAGRSGVWQYRVVTNGRES